MNAWEQMGSEMERRHNIHDFLQPSGNKAFDGIHFLALKQPTNNVETCKWAADRSAKPGDLARFIDLSRPTDPFQEDLKRCLQLQDRNSDFNYKED